MTSKKDPAVERLLDQWASSQGTAPLSETTRAGIQTTLARSFKPVRRLASQPRLALTFFGVFAAGSLILMAILDKAGFHLMTRWQMVWMTVIFAAGAMLFSSTLAADMVPGSRRRMPFALVLTLSASSVIAAIALLFPWRTSSAFVSEGRPCGLVELIVAIPAAAVFWLLARRGVLFASAGLGAALTGLGVFLALTPLQFQCMFQQAPHLLVWHAGTAMMLIGLGAWAGQRLRP